jgi:molybdate transport system ATP-binding protein
MRNTLRALDFFASLHLTIFEQAANFEFFNNQLDDCKSTNVQPAEGGTMFVISRTSSTSLQASAAPQATASQTIACDFNVRVCGCGAEFELHSRFRTNSRRIALFGPSGSGKSLTLMALAGLLTPGSGHIEVRGRTFFESKSGVNIPARKRNVGMLFQDYALFPHLSVRDNVAFGLKPTFGLMKPAHHTRIDELLELCGLTKLAGLRPHQISGGQRQRTALARALAPGPDLLLLDEPFTALDQPLRERMRDELSAILERFDIPMIMVSHDLDDVDHFAQTLVAFGQGRVLDVVDYQARRKNESPRQILDPLFLAAQTCE